MIQVRANRTKNSGCFSFVCINGCFWKERCYEIRIYVNQKRRWMVIKWRYDPHEHRKLISFMVMRPSLRIGALSSIKIGVLSSTEVLGKQR